MNSHRMWHHRKDRDDDFIEDASSGKRFIIPRSLYQGLPYAERVSDKQDDMGGPLATVWLPLGSHGEVGMTVNRYDAQAIVDALREVFPPSMSFRLEPDADWPGIK